MNHLAHLFLSQSDINLMVGNFIADHIKGKQILSFSSKVQNGIKMHRAIDDFTDHHAVVRKSKERLYPKYHKYAAVIVDMFYDHILARKFKDYSPISLSSFAQASYQILNAQKQNLPEHSQRFLHYMSENDWLSSYGTEIGIHQALSGLSRRTSFDSKMEESSADLKKDYALYESEFQSFFPELFEFCQQWMKTNE